MERALYLIRVFRLCIMALVCKSFEQLSKEELYAILRARAEVFVVEQNCAYQDLDDLDEQALHIFREDDGRILSYARINEMQSDTVKISRVLSTSRDNGFGREIMESVLKTIGERFGSVRAVMEAQSYAVGFYRKFGFTVCSEEFDLDGIPHVLMEAKL